MTANDNSGALPEMRGKRVREDERGGICLNDLWELAGKPNNRRPNDWHRSVRAKALEAALQERITEISRKYGETPDLSTHYTTGRGRGRLTWAHPVLALDYAEFVEPVLGVEVRELFLRYRADPIKLANDILDAVAEQVQEDEYRVHNREEMRKFNSDLQAEGKKARCTKGWHYAELHNAGYRGLYNGLDKSGIHALKGLTQSQDILDHMCAAEGAANVFRATQAIVAMKKRKPKSPDAAAKIMHNAGVRTRQAMQEIGGVMPEDMEPADSVKDAAKRLKANKPLIESKRRMPDGTDEAA